MVLGLVLIAVAIGLAAVAVVLASGGSFLQALLTYSAIGSVTLLASALLAASRRDRTATSAAMVGNTDMTKLPRVLIVDDDPAARLLGVAVLADTRVADVTLAASGAEALALAKAPDARFDAVLIDIMMPRMDGIELCRHLRALPATQSVPLIMLTARGDLVHLSRAFAAGADDYLVKPFKAAELQLLVQALPRGDRDAAVPVGQSFREPRDLGPIPGFLRYDAAENFLLRQRTRRPAGQPEGVASSQAVVLRLRDAGTLNATLGEESFEACLRRTAEALSAETRRAEAFLTYQGEGVFLCLPRGNAVIDAASLARRVNERLARAKSKAADAGAPQLAVDAMDTKDKDSLAVAANALPQGKDSPA